MHDIIAIVINSFYSDAIENRKSARDAPSLGINIVSIIVFIIICIIALVTYAIHSCDCPKKPNTPRIFTLVTHSVYTNHQVFNLILAAHASEPIREVFNLIMANLCRLRLRLFDMISSTLRLFNMICSKLRLSKT